MHTFAKRLIVLTLVAALAAASLAKADDGERDGDDDHHGYEAVRGAVERGEVKSLAEVLQVIRPSLAGEIVGVEIEREGGAWIYEFRVADRNGRIFEVYVDAASARILKTEEK